MQDFQTEDLHIDDNPPESISLYNILRFSKCDSKYGTDELGVTERTIRNDIGKKLNSEDFSGTHENITWYNILDFKNVIQTIQKISKWKISIWMLIHRNLFRYTISKISKWKISISNIYPIFYCP